MTEIPVQTEQKFVSLNKRKRVLTVEAFRQQEIEPGHDDDFET